MIKLHHYLFLSHKHPITIKIIPEPDWRRIESHKIPIRTDGVLHSSPHPKKKEFILEFKNKIIQI